MHEEHHAPDLIARAYAHGNASKYLLVKGSKDYIVNSEGILDIVDRPVEESMEAISGTGDTLTGIVAGLCAAGISVKKAAGLAARTNRLAGSYAHPTPAIQVMEIIRYIPQALNVCMRKDQ